MTLARIKINTSILTNLLDLPQNTKIHGVDFEMVGEEPVINLLAEHPDFPTIKSGEDCSQVTPRRIEYRLTWMGQPVPPFVKFQDWGLEDDKGEG